ncbi:MAG: phosphatase PAP2 family protein [Candidatus Nanohaloarchaea archaeon]
MNKEKVAETVSQVFHPAVIEIPAATAGLLVYGLKTEEILIYAVLPLIGVTGTIYGLLNTSRFEKLDMNTRSDRNKIYVVAILSLSIVGVLTYYFQGPGVIKRLSPAAIGIGLINYSFNQRIKISLHTTGMGLVTALFANLNWVLGLFFLAASFAVAWSRIQLERHTPAEAFLGFTVSFTLILIALTF